MRWSKSRSLAAGLGLAAVVVATAAPPIVSSQEEPACLRAAEISADLGSPGQEGVTLEYQMNRVDEVRRYRFTLPTLMTAYVYVGDQWYDLDLGVYSIAQDRLVGCWRVSAQEGASERRQRRVLQLIRPDERVLDELIPGDYELVVRPAGAGFDPRRAFTIRVALGPPVCGLTPANDEVDPKYPQLKRRRADEQNLYQLGMTYEPLVPERFDLITFNAFVSPPYSDLFDFEWQIDGRSVPGAGGLTLQRPVAELPPVAGGRHQVRLTARGARQYPDPEQPHIPPTLAVECTFVVRG